MPRGTAVEGLKIAGKKMCGRARCTLRANDISRAAHINDGSFRSVNMDMYQPSYNVAPGFNLPVIRRANASDGSAGRCDDDDVVMHCMKWGLVPSFTKAAEKPDHYKMFNARSETISEKASFRRLIPHNRCIVAVEGFYEWKKDGTKKQPYYIHLKDGRPLVFAALYDSWKNTEGAILHTFTILTTSSASSLQWLHDRMPVILGDKESTDAWLSGSLTKYDMLLKPFKNSDLVWYPVTPEMGKPSFNGPECIKEIKSETKNQILNFFSKKEPNSDNDTKPKFTFPSSEIPNSNLPSSGTKDEPETEVQARILYHTDVETIDSKPSVSELPQKGDRKSQIKRECEDFGRDSRPTSEETNKFYSTPTAKKKKKTNGNQTNDDPKQLKLGSFFRKS